MTKTLLRTELRRLLDILRKHPGKENAISMIDLFEEYTGNKVERDEDGKPRENIATLSRGMRNLIDELIACHAIPIMSSTSAGYWMVTNEKELGDVYHEFMSRGITSIQKAARLKCISVVDAVQQLALDLENNESAIKKRITQQSSKKQTLDLGEQTLSREARLAVITKYMQSIVSSPDEFADEIHALQQQFGPKLLPQSVINSINQQADHVRLLANQTIDAATKLQVMIGK